ncbi:MAG: DUF1398 family protein [Verrucomicrobia bacterium]|nr:DUF1398 family protein [Verrucomicrobiota bacterium]
MFDPKKVLEIATTSKAEKWPYPKTFHALLEAGVESYEVDVATHRIVYFGDDKRLVEEPPAGFQNLPIADKWNPQGVKDAIEFNRNVTPDYQVFLKGISSSGVIAYRVDMHKKHISYLGREKGQEYAEKLPF